MFTGIVEEQGTVRHVDIRGRTAQLVVQSIQVHQDARRGDSIAINGCCLTLTALEHDLLHFEAVPETMERTNLGDLTSGDLVNLERALRADGRLGGHFVQGHIDGIGLLQEVRKVENASVLLISAPPELRRYLVEKGSVAVDGVSLTVAAVNPEGFTVWIIPHTLEVTTLGARRHGARVNLECDLLGKYVERLLAEQTAR